MDRTDLVLGIFLGLTGALAGSFIFITLFTPYTVADGLFIIRESGQISKILSLGAIVNLAIFFGLLKFKKDVIAKGVLLSMFVITLATIILYYI
ncbi:hypothetical protein HUK80_16605 [Flavobacterium sp. MAH-1]|uniref:Uncharacterized protein n=1 Tax=Flavobacterium agri TaxID=2743471 RepID=A0A7Y8Y4V1_9FLAO|nr:hypothetical protein [Flavobacterium agri]NUY82527.1 hypothetical protein [Flavobacterium agri]NYA72551.1 hypothetical protein [Flavobacterium agri]